MYIKELYQSGPVISCEIFPPKKDSDIGGIYEILGAMSAMRPDYISVTYGAGGGGNGNKTAEIAARIRQEYGIPALAHLTCITAEPATIQDTLSAMRGEGVCNVLALRGDIPADYDPASVPGHYRYAEEMIRDIKARGDFCIGAACYPEGHIDCADNTKNIEHLRRKQDAGADFLISQLFFDNDLYLRFLEDARRGGITLPISAGVMPFLSRKQIERMIFMCGASLPSRIIKLLHKYADTPDDLRRAGIEYAAEQIEELVAAGVDGVHIYTMNKPDIAETCMRRIGRVQ